MDKKLILVISIIVLVVLLAASFYAGFFIGNKNGFARGEKQGKEQGFKAAQDIVNAANPYAELEDVANPFQEEYENPF
jgi:flagellar basal body-associated protein FliL